MTFTTGSTALPTTCVKTTDLIVAGKPAQYGDKGEYFDAVANLSTWLWTILGPNVLITPAPAVSPVSVLWFTRGEPDLTADTSSPLLPEAHQQILLARAAYHAEVRRARADAAQFHNGEYERGLVNMRDAIKRRTGTRRIRESNSRYWATW